MKRIKICLVTLMAALSVTAFVVPTAEAYQHVENAYYNCVGASRASANSAFGLPANYGTFSWQTGYTRYGNEDVSVNVQWLYPGGGGSLTYRCRVDGYDANPNPAYGVVIRRWIAFQLLGP